MLEVQVILSARRNLADGLANQEVYHALIYELRHRYGPIDRSESSLRWERIQQLTISPFSWTPEMRLDTFLVYDPS
jgi:hypothetical protein